jgi:hypothetical protein
MKPIISPIWFYLVNLFSKVGDFAMALIIGGIILTVLFAIFLLVVETEGDFESEEERRRWYGYLKKGIITIIAAGVLYCAIPSETTCYKMMAAQVVMPDNISTVGKTSEDIINYIVESVKEITDSNEDSESAKKN